MSAFTVQSNGYLYPSRQLTPAELATLIGLVHRLACTEGLSHRQVQKRLIDFHVRRSTGAISQYLSRYECDACASPPDQRSDATPPDLRRDHTMTRPEVIAWR